MANTEIVNFLAADGSAVCTLKLYAPGNWQDVTGLQAIELVPAAQALDAGEAAVQLLEGVRYEYELSVPGYQLALAQHYYAAQGVVLPSSLAGRKHCGVLNPGLFTGQLPLVVQADGVVLGWASVEVRSRKLSYKSDYQHMLQDITARCVDLLQEMRSPSAFNAEPDPGNDPATIGQRFAFVRALLQNRAFENALHRITTHPHQTWLHEAEDRPLSRGFKPSGKLLRQLAQGGRRVNVPVAHPLHSTLKTLPERVTVDRATLTTDTPENRFVKFALRSFHQFLDTMRGQVKDVAKDARLLQEIDALCTRLDEALASDVMRRASEPTFSPLGSPTLQRREGYREVLQAWLHFAMAAKLVWHGGDKVYGAGQRDVATLYEYWVFFELLKIVAEVFKLDHPASETLIEPTGDGFGLKLKAGQHMALTGRSVQKGRVLEVRFSYNRSFRATGQARVAGSWTQDLRPDYTLSLWPVGFNEDQAELQELMVHVHFDAKYRIEQVAQLLASHDDSGALTDEALAAELDNDKLDEKRGTYKRADLLKMHAYRDAIRRTQGAYVVYPGPTDSDKRMQGFHEVLPGLGAFALRPGSGTAALTAFLGEVVAHVADRSSAREQQSFHTYKTYEQPFPGAAEEQRGLYEVVPERAADGKARHTPLRETFVVVGWVKTPAHLDWIKKSGKYNFRMGSKPGALRLSAQVAGACYLLLHGDDGEAVPGLFSIKDPAAGPQVCSADDLKKLGYPTAPTQPSYLVYDIEPATDFADYTCNYGALQGKPASGALGYPFATSLLDILIARKPKIP
ncbi:MAG: DUF2357 domain-containing protein [Chitinophagaceae bacterium]|nr:DUF2357 domain-containing protein [Polaromonas sp.]